MKVNHRYAALAVLWACGCTADNMTPEAERSSSDTAEEMASAERPLSSGESITVQLPQGRFDGSQPKFKTVQIAKAPMTDQVRASTAFAPELEAVVDISAEFSAERRDELATGKSR